MEQRERNPWTARMVGTALSAALFATGLAACGGEAGGELEITNLDPRAGATAGDQTVRILGNNFRSDISYTVYFGTKRVERSTLMDEHTLLVATPSADDGGSVDVIVQADNGAAFRIVNGFEYAEMGGNVMENVGSTTSGQGEERF